MITDQKIQMQTFRKGTLQMKPKKREPFFHPDNPLSPRNWGIVGWIIAVWLLWFTVRQVIKVDCQTDGQICQFVRQFFGN